MDASGIAPILTSPAPNRSPAGPLDPWSRRVRWVGGLTQAAFAAFWLLRGTLVINGSVASVLLPVFALLVIGVFAYGFREARGTAPRPRTLEDRRIERGITLASAIEFAAAIALPVLVTAAGRSDWTLPSIAITVGPLLLWLDRRLTIPRYRFTGWVLTVGPLLLIATLSGTALVASTGIAAGMLLLATALAGFRDLSLTRRTAVPLLPAAGLAPAGVRS